MPSLFHAGFVAAALVALPLVASPAFAEKVNVLSDAPATGLGSSYAWTATAGMVGSDPRIDNDIVQTRMQNAINSAMAVKGYHLADTASADILLTYHIGIRDGSETQVNTMPSGPMMCGRFGCGGGYRWGYYGAPEVSAREIRYAEGSLMVDVHDRVSDKLVWRAVYDKRLNGKGEQKTFDKAASTTLKSLPRATAQAK